MTYIKQSDKKLIFLLRCNYRQEKGKRGEYASTYVRSSTVIVTVLDPTAMHRTRMQRRRVVKSEFISWYAVELQSDSG